MRSGNFCKIDESYIIIIIQIFTWHASNWYETRRPWGAQWRLLGAWALIILAQNCILVHFHAGLNVKEHLRTSKIHFLLSTYSQTMLAYMNLQDLENCLIGIIKEDFLHLMDDGKVCFVINDLKYQMSLNATVLITLYILSIFDKFICDIFIEYKWYSEVHI
jgi:hypothetical protein